MMLNPANRSINTTTYITQLDRPVSLPSPPNSFFTSFIHNGICTLRHQPRPPGRLAVHSARRLAHCYLSNRWCQNTDSLFLATGQGSSLLVRCEYNPIDQSSLSLEQSTDFTSSPGQGARQTGAPPPRNHRERARNPQVARGPGTHSRHNLRQGG